MYGPELHRGSRTVVILALVAAAVGALGLLGYSRSGSTSESASATTTVVANRTGVDGFAAVQLTVTQANGQGGSYCALLASTEAQQARGMMGRKDLGGYDAMVFAFAADVTSQFFMANVTIPLSIAWIKGNGQVLATTDMPPCSTEAKDCPRYSAGGAYRTAIEVPQGGLAPLGISAGSTVTASGPCR